MKRDYSKAIAWITIAIITVAFWSGVYNLVS